MGKPKRKLTTAEKAAKKRRRKEFMYIFVQGKQKRVRRAPTIDAMDPDEFIRRNADPLWLHQNEMWEYLEPEPPIQPIRIPDPDSPAFKDKNVEREEDDDIPF